MVAAAVGGGAPRRALLQARARRGQPRDRRGRRRGRPVHRRVQHLDAPRRRREGRCGSSRRRCACSPTGTCATRSRPTTPTERTASRSSAQIAQVMERIVTQTIPQVVIDNPLRGLEPGRPTTVKAARRARTPTKPAPTPTRRSPTRPSPTPATRCSWRRSRRRARRTRTRRPRRRSSPGASNENRQIPEARVGRCSRRSSPRRSSPRVAALIEKRLGRPLEPFDIWYSGFKPRGKYTEDAARRDRPEAVPHGRGLPGGHPEHPRQARLLEGDAPSTWPTTSSSIRRAARATPLGAARRARQGAPAHARREGRDELQGLQHRGPRDGAQRRADVLAQRHRPRRCCRACRTPPSPRRWRSSSRRTTSSSSASPKPDAQSQRAARRSTTSGRPTRSPASRSSTWPSGTGCTTTRTRRRRS